LEVNRSVEVPRVAEEEEEERPEFAPEPEFPIEMGGEELEQPEQPEQPYEPTSPGEELSQPLPPTPAAEDIGLSDRTKRMHKFLSNTFNQQPESAELSYNQLIEGKARRTVVGTFFELLVLKTRNVVDLKQKEPYGDILVFKTVSKCRVHWMLTLSCSLPLMLSQFSGLILSPKEFNL
jgi:cohesin complex subunit SCC1